MNAKACLVLVLLWPAASEAADALAAEPEPVGIYGGAPVGPCGWPTTVYVNDCTGTLVHPSVVVLAAHCIAFGGQAYEVRFGENLNAPARTVGVDGCTAHPGWQDVPPGDNASDIAICTLTTPVEDVPIVPIAMGCETDALEVGAAVTLVGFGDADDALGYGPKRAVETQIKQVGTDAAWIGGDGASSCYGDSGGPAFIQLADGTWRVFGATSGSATDDPGCGQTSIWTLVHVYADWIESTAGVDVTPCFDTDGTWNPNEACAGFPMSPAIGSGAWADGCPGELAEMAQTCAPGTGTGTTGEGTDDGGSSEGGGEDETSGGDVDESTTDVDVSDDATTADAPLDGGTDSAPEQQGEQADSGCGCTSAPSPSFGMAWLGLLLLRRNRPSRGRKGPQLAVAGDLRRE